MSVRKFKTILFLIVLILLALISLAQAGVDEMRQRQPGYAPIEQVDPTPDHHQDGHSGGGPKVPIDDYLPILALGAIIYGVYKIQNKNISHCDRQN